MKGWIGFTTRHNSPVSGLIRAALASPVSHGFVGVGMEEGEGKPARIIEATTRGVKMGDARKYSNPKRHRMMLYEPIDMEPWEIERGIRYAAALLGKEYGWGQVAGIAWKLFIDAFARSNGHSVIRRGIICSEVQWVYLAAVDPSIIEGMHRNDATPHDIWRRIYLSNKWRPRHALPC